VVKAFRNIQKYYYYGLACNLGYCLQYVTQYFSTAHESGLSHAITMRFTIIISDILYKYPCMSCVFMLLHATQLVHVSCMQPCWLFRIPPREAFGTAASKRQTQVSLGGQVQLGGDTEVHMG
jgi:hypothetical protein